MSKNSLIICTLDRTPICDLMDNTPQRVRNIIENRETNIITDLKFDLPIANPKWVNIVNENLVLYKDEYYVIKNPTFNHDEDGKLYVSVSCKHYSNNLAEDLISLEETTPLNVIELMKLALCYEDGKPTKGWSIGNVTVDRVALRGLEAMEQSPFSILLTIAEKYNGMLHFNSKSMTVDLLELNETTKPTIDIRGSKNLKSVSISYDTSEMYTRLYCYGAPDEDDNELDIMSVNPTGKPYIDNFDYFYKLGYTKDFVASHPELFVKTTIWRDSNYYDAQDLYDDGVKELAKIAQPIVEVSISALDISTLGGGNNPCNLAIGDCVRIVDEELGLDTLCNVTKREINYEEPHILNITVTNSITYHDTLSKLFTNVNTVSSIVTSGGHVIGAGGVKMGEVQGYLNTYYLNSEQIDAKYVNVDTLDADYLTANEIKTNYLDAEAIGATYATIGSLNAVEAKIQDLDVTELTAKVANIEQATIDLAEIDKLFATEAEIEELKTNNLTVAGKLKASDAEIDTIKTTYAQIGSFEAYKGTVENLFATNAEIESLKAKYIDALEIETDVAKVKQLEAAIAKIETLEATIANVEQLVSKTIITDDLEASQATIEVLNTKLANIETAIIDIAKVENLEAANAQIENLNAEYVNAVKVDVDTLNAKSATIEQLNAYTLKSEFGEFKNLTVDNLNAANANIGSLDANVANINSVLAGNVGTGLLQTIHLTGKNVVIEDAVIKSANIESIDTDVVTVGNDNIILSGSTQQFKDSNGNVRVQIGQDAKGDFSFIVANENGATVIDADGVTENAIPDGLIVDKMVADDAGIQASKVKYVDKNGNKTLQTVIEVEQGRIENLIKETTIDGESLKDKYLDTVQTVDGIETTIGNVSMLGNGETLVSSITSLKATANGITAQVSSIGGQNLFYYSNKDWLSKTIGEDYIFVGCYKEETDNDMEGREVTLSIEIDKDSSTSGTFDICYYNVDNPISSNVVTLFKNIPLTNIVDGKYKNTFTYPTTSAIVANADGTMPMFTMVIKVSNINGNFKVRKGMLQFGKMATEWQPTTDNVSDSVAKVEIEANKINWLVKSGSNATDFTLTDRTATLVSEQINLHGLVSFSGLNSEVSDEILGKLSEEPAEGSTVIHGGRILTDTITSEQINTDQFFSDEATIDKITSYEIHANRIVASEDGSKIKGFLIDAVGLEVKQQDTNIVTFSVEKTGDVTMRGSVESYNYVSGKSGWSINKNGNAEFNDVVVRGSLVTDMGGIADVESDNVQVLYWAGESYEQRENAPFIVYSDGSMKATKGTFGGVFTGDIQIGNISIIDPSSSSGNDAILTIQNGNNGIKRVQLRDTDYSSFAQDIWITDNFGNNKIQLSQDGHIDTTAGIVVNNNSLTSDGLNIGGATISGNSSNMNIISSMVNIGTYNSDSDLKVFGGCTIEKDAKLNKDLLFGNTLVASHNEDGIDFNFVNDNVTFTVTFVSNGGSSVAPIRDVPLNSKITQPTNPTRNNYTFYGWYRDALLNVRFNFDSDVIDDNITLYAKWTIVPAVAPTYTITNGTFVSENGKTTWTTPYVINASTGDGGTLSYHWDIDYYDSSGEFLALEDVFANKITNNITVEELNRYCDWTYGVLKGKCTITNTKENTTATTVVNIYIHG